MKTAVDCLKTLAQYSPSDLDIDVLVPALETIAVILQWNDPFGGSGNDYDLHLLNFDASLFLTSSTNEQNGDDDPLEQLTFTNPLVFPITVKIIVDKFAGVNKKLKICR